MLIVVGLLQSHIDIMLEGVSELRWNIWRIQCSNVLSVMLLLGERATLFGGTFMNASRKRRKVTVQIVYGKKGQLSA